MPRRRMALMRDPGGCRGIGQLEIVAPGAAKCRQPRHEEPVDRARPVENAKNAFPTRSLDAQRTRAHTLHRPCIFGMTKDKHKDHGGESACIHGDVS